MTAAPRPVELRLRRTERVLELRFDTGEHFSLPCEYLRVFSPSAEVQGHGAGQRVLLADKSGVGIRDIVPVGQYAVQLVFDDGHDSGLYSWATLYALARDQAANWQRYLDEMAAAGIARAG